jgi:NADP-reducing hydrogenase subunit HndC
MKDNKIYENVICVCLGKNCKGNGGDEIYRTFRKSLKKGPQGKRTLLIKTKCFDLCKKGPIVVKDKQLFTHFSPEEV